VQRDVPAPRAGVLTRADVRALGLVVVALGGGRQRPGERIDHRVGLSHLLPLGSRVAAGEALARVHAADDAGAAQAVAAVRAAFHIGDQAVEPGAVIVEAVIDLS
jgi:thymidine phosphorylase